jgi:hypothetical protein
MRRPPELRPRHFAEIGEGAYGRRPHQRLTQGYLRSPGGRPSRPLYGRVLALTALKNIPEAAIAMLTGATGTVLAFILGWLVPRSRPDLYRSYSNTR